MVRDGKEGPAFDRIPPWVMTVIAFSRDGLRLAHLARRGDQTLVVLDGVETPAPAGTESIVLAPDGRKVLCDVHADGRRYLWAGGRRTPDDVFIWAEFSRDSRHLRYVARRGTRSVMVADGFEGPEHDAVHWIDFGAETETSFRYFVIDAGRETLVEVDWPSGADWTNSFEPVKL